jgi:hypothetical protein
MIIGHNQRVGRRNELMYRSSIVSKDIAHVRAAGPYQFLDKFPATLYPIQGHKFMICIRITTMHDDRLGVQMDLSKIILVYAYFCVLRMMDEFWWA